MVLIKIVIAISKRIVIMILRRIIISVSEKIISGIVILVLIFGMKFIAFGMI